MSALWHRLRVWLWRWEPRYDARASLRYERMQNRHRSMRWRRAYALRLTNVPIVAMSARGQCPICGPGYRLGDDGCRHGRNQDTRP